MKNRSSNRIYSAAAIALGLMLPASEVFAKAVEIIDSIDLHPTEFVSRVQQNTPVRAKISPTLFVYENAGWNWQRVQAQLMRASELLSQCSVGLGSVRYVRVKAHNGDEVSGNGRASELKQKLYNIPNVQAYSRPHVLFLDDHMHVKPNADNKLRRGVTLVGKFGNQERVLDEFWRASIFIAYVDSFEVGLSNSKGLNRYNTLAHEFVHALTVMDHESRAGTLMSEKGTSWDSDYISSDYCRAMMESPLIHR